MIYLLSAVLMGVSLFGCDIASESQKSVHGHILSLEIADSGQLSQVQLEDEAGNQRYFHVKGELDVAVSHLRIHQSQGIPVTLRLESVSGRDLVVAIED